MAYIKWLVIKGTLPLYNWFMGAVYHPNTVNWIHLCAFVPQPLHLRIETAPVSEIYSAWTSKMVHRVWNQ